MVVHLNYDQTYESIIIYFNIDIGKIENLYYRPTILMRYSKVLYKTMLREIKNDEKKFSRWKKREWNSQLLEDYQNINMVNKVQVPRNVNNDGVRGEAGQECEFLIRMCRFPRLTSSVTRLGYSLDRVYVAFMGINTCLRFFSWFGARHHPIGSNTFTSVTVFNQTWMTIKALSKC